MRSGFTSVDLKRCLFLLIVFIGAPVSADENTHPSSLVLATTEHFAPYAFQTNSDEWQGIDVDITKSLFEGMGIELKIIGLPRKRIRLMLERDKIDGLISTTPFQTELPKEFVWKSAELYETEISFFALRKNRLPESVDDLINDTNFRIGILLGYQYHIKNYDLPKRKNIIQALTDYQLTKLLQIERVDAVVAEDIAFIYQARKRDLFKDVYHVSDASSRSVHFALTRNLVNKYPSFAREINNRIEALHANAVIDDVLVKYLDID